MLALALASPAAARAQSSWSVELAITEGPLTIGEARPVLEGLRSEVAACATGAGPYRLAYVIAFGASGRTREAAPDRSTGAELAPARAVRCVRHLLEELAVATHDAPSRAAVTFVLGSAAREPAPPAAEPEAPGTASDARPPDAAGRASSPPDGSGAGEARRTVAIASIDGGTRSSASLRAVLDARLGELAACHADAPDAAGRGTLRLGVGASGRVERALFSGAEALASAVAVCIGAAARTWAFPAGEAASVEIGLDFGAAPGASPRPVPRAPD